MRGAITLALAAVGVGRAAPAVEAPGDLTIALAPRPTKPGSDGVGTIAVTLSIAAAPVAAGQPVLRLPLIASNVDTVATTLTDLTLRDARGIVPVSTRTVDLPTGGLRDAEAGGPSREWIAGRATTGRITAHYTVPAAATLPPRGAAPPFAFSDDGDATSAAGHVFLLLPPSDRRYRARVTWDLSALPKGARGISSFGEGDAAAPEPLAAGDLRSTFFMAGRIGARPTPVPRGGFFGAWQGRPAFDAAALMRWAGMLYGHYVTFFGQRAPAPYGVFLRYNPVNAGGGVGLYHSFALTYGAGRGSDPDGLRSTLAHEMFHTFSPYIVAPSGLASSWFGEGLAVFYQRQLPLRFGQITPAAFLEDLNGTAARYYTSAMTGVPNADIPARFWADTRVRTLPYDRGSLYFATVDDALRTTSHGRTSLDTLLLEMRTRERAGHKLANANWEQLLARELSTPAVAAFHDMLAGALVLPRSEAFGPCFRRITAPLRRYALGFETAVLAEPRRIVRGLDPAGPAAAAGLRNADEIMRPVPQDGIQGDQHAMLTLDVRRGSERRTITYLPRGEIVQAYQWERIADVPDTACALPATEKP